MADQEKPKTDEEDTELTSTKAETEEEVSAQPDNDSPDGEADTPETDDIHEAEIVEAEPDETADASPEDENSLLDHVVPDSTPMPEPEPEPTPAATEKPSGAGLGTMLLGGVLAAAIGLGAAKFILPQSWLSDQSGSEELRATLQTQKDQIASLTTGMSELTEAVQDRSGIDTLTTQIDALTASVTGRLDKISEDVTAQSLWLGEIDARLTTVEKAPMRASNDASVAAYERELEKMRAALEKQQAENDRIAADVSSMADKARADIDAASDRAQKLETRAAMLRIQAALESGGGFAAALQELNTDVPEALSAVAQDGVASLSELQASFPAAAREGLQASLHATAGEDPANRVSAFLRGQFGVRSLEPREGDDPDAILSRAEAALGSGSIDGALAEIVMLPPDGQSAMTDWVSAARARLDALAAAGDLAETLNIN